ncbi:hypothetical protein BDN70DRAFT_873052 [Pholiota conissans]|uniref:BOD1/SHG1 domain-containing protein n=1 Tax=Pholiota conissans TaxID=109636 RepID=A0A9P5ZA55_9AGAR|nr:hypothetical protein BDN70DRAFT_873052 [Pholiota conissans]
MPIDNPTALVEEFKKSGEFDRLRREVLTRFQQDGSYSALKSRVEEIGRQRLATDQTLQYSSQETVHKELAQEVERYPIVERAVADVRIFSDASFLSSIQTSIQKILNDEPRSQSSLPKEIIDETSSKESSMKAVDDSGHAKLQTGPSPEFSSIDTNILYKDPSLQEYGVEDKAETTEPRSSNVGPQSVREPLPGASTSKPNLVSDDSNAMDIDPAVD